MSAIWRLDAGLGAAAAAGAPSRDHPYQSKNENRKSEMGPISQNLTRVREEEGDGERSMSEVRSEPCDGGVHASVRFGDENSCDEKCGDDKSTGFGDENSEGGNSEKGGSGEAGSGASAEGAGIDGGGADAPLALPRVGRWHVLKLPAEAGDKDLLGRGLMSYGTVFSDSYRQTGVYTGRILKRRKTRRPAGRAVDQVRAIINLITA